jgi:hypothetical protein
LEVGAWIFPGSGSFRTAGLVALVAVDGDAARFRFAREP